MPEQDPKPRSDATLEVRISHILTYMDSIDLDLIKFMDGLLYGDERCTANPQIRQKRTRLLNHPLFGEMLSRCYNRPRKASGELRVGTKSLFTFANACIQDAMRGELDSLVPDFQTDDRISEAALLKTDFTQLKDICSLKAPTLYNILTGICTTTGQQTRNKIKTAADNIIVLVISVIMYHRSSRNNVVQRFLSIYWVACGVSSRAWGLLNTFGLAMSSTWSQDAITTLTKDALRRIREWTAVNPFAVIYDNLNIAYKVSSQRIDHRNHFDSGTAFTILPLPVEFRTHFINSSRRGQLDNWEHAADKKTLSWDQIYSALQSSEEMSRAYSVFHVIQFLLDHPVFAGWQENLPNANTLGFPGDMDPLPAGPQNRTKQWPLRTVHIDESTLEGTTKVIQEIWRQCRFNDSAGISSLATERVVPIIGDQKSVSLMRSLRGLRGRDYNGFERMDYAILLKGWFHEVMALQHQLHRQHLGTNAGVGLARDITRLSRIGLKPQSKSGKMDFHDLHELLAIVLQARILDCWLTHTRCTTLTELAAKNLSAEEIQQLAAEIVEKFTSERSLYKMRKRPAKDQDHIWIANALFLRDALIYWEITRAIRVGDVGRMANITPTLLVMFVGGGSHNYAFELLEEMQIEMNELEPHEVFALRHNCWLANTSGKRQGFFPLDQLQEHNIRDIKHVYAPRGPNASWDFLGRISPVIPTLRAVSAHISGHFHVGPRGSKHAEVSKWADIGALLTMYGEGGGMHQFIPGRHMVDDTSVTDVIRTGILDLSQNTTLKTWRQSREKYLHAKQQERLEHATTETPPITSLSATLELHDDIPVCFPDEHPEMDFFEMWGAEAVIQEMDEWTRMEFDI